MHHINKHAVVTQGHMDYKSKEGFPWKCYELFIPPTTRYTISAGPALTAVWSKVPPLTVRCLSPLSGFESRSGHVRKLPVTWG